MATADSDAEQRQAPENPVDYYRAALGDLSHYAIELEEEVTADYRRALTRLAAEAEAVAPEAAPDVLRDYRGKAAAYVNRLCEELTIATRRLQQILDSLADADGDYEGRVRNALARLREAAQSPEAGEIGGPLLETSAAIQDGLDAIREGHEAAVSQLMAEIQTLHKRIDQLESESSFGLLAALLTRAEMQRRIGELPPGAPRLALLSLTGLQVAEARFGSQVRTQMTAAFLKRLGRFLPAGTVVGRWAEEEFMAILAASQEAAGRVQNALAEQLSGAYVCLLDGKPVRPALQVRATVLRANQVSESVFIPA